MLKRILNLFKRREKKGCVYIDPRDEYILSLKRCDDIPEELRRFREVYRLKQCKEILVVELGACKHLAIPKHLVESGEVIIGVEPPDPLQFFEPCDTEEQYHYHSADTSNYILVPSPKRRHCPHVLRYYPHEQVLEWESGAAVFRMSLVLP